MRARPFPCADEKQNAIQTNQTPSTQAPKDAGAEPGFARFSIRIPEAAPRFKRFPRIFAVFLKKRQKFSVAASFPPSLPLSPEVAPSAAPRKRYLFSPQNINTFLSPRLSTFHPPARRQLLPPLFLNDKILRAKPPAPVPAEVSFPISSYSPRAPPAPSPVL